MSRDALPFVAPDVSAFAKHLGASLKSRAEPPSHVELLNLIARAAGHRNFQALRASAVPPAPPLAAEDWPPLALSATAQRALQQFDSRGRLVRWPAKFAVQTLCMWVLWTLFDRGRVYAEREVNAVLKTAHTFGDHATLRRELVNHKLLGRTADCMEYRKLQPRADDETRALLAAWRRRTRDGGA